LSGRRWLPHALAERARAFAAGGLEPVDPRPAATVVLLRNGAAGPEAYLLRRRSSMAFAAGMHVFPGGGVDPRDVGDRDVGWYGPSVAEWAIRLDTDEGAARGFVCAAVRETFEEAGVLLASPRSSVGTPSPADHATMGRHADSPDSLAFSGDRWEADRQALVDRRLALSELLDRRSLAVRTDLLAPWAHWITPRFEHRRYDTWFFVAALPAGQAARDVSGESDQARWVRPADAVAAADRGDAAMLPPTRSVLGELADFPSVAAVLDATGGRTIEPIMPGWLDDGGRVWALLPGDPGFPGDDHGRASSRGVS
jgi:8-oxo-dGTP pyrophosphatase MutT (NUDIX family)